jgi:uncharacterized protein YdeI (YjbR/CyaY-like superfamily)
MLKHKDLFVLSFKNQALFEKWLEKNFDKSKAMWLRFYKKGSGIETINYTEAVDSAICYGWIDGLVNTYDKDSYVQRFTPRKSKSLWSKINVEKVEKFLKEKRMKPSGIKLVEEAKKNGSWDKAYAGQSKMEIPADFLKLLQKKENKEALDFFKTFNKPNLYAVYIRLHTTADVQKRENKMLKFIEQFKNKKSFHPIKASKK